MEEELHHLGDVDGISLEPEMILSEMPGKII
jgi:hypothetical protein